MQTYRVTVVASYRGDADMSEMFGLLAIGGPIETSGVITLIEDDGIRHGQQTLIVTYDDVEGRTGDLARLLAVAIFKLESSRWPVPEPEAVVANLAEIVVDSEPRLV
jgi:hypothetical protein